MRSKKKKVSFWTFFLHQQVLNFAPLGGSGTPGYEPLAYIDFCCYITGCLHELSTVHMLKTEMCSIATYLRRNGTCKHANTI